MSIRQRIAAALGPGSDPAPLVAAAPVVPVRELFRRFWPDVRPYRGWLLLSLPFIAAVPAIAVARGSVGEADAGEDGRDDRRGTALDRNAELLIDEKRGSYFFIGTLLTSLEHDLDPLAGAAARTSSPPQAAVRSARARLRYGHCRPRSCHRVLRQFSSQSQVQGQCLSVSS